MNRLRFSLSWQAKLISRKQKATRSVEEYTEPTLPTLPREIWRKIISFTIRLAGADAFELDDPFATPSQNEEHPEIDVDVFKDRKNMMHVSSQWRHDVTEICCEYLTIYTASELRFLVKMFEQAEASGERLGEWTRRIDFKILGRYNVSHVVRLLKCTPNLLIYNNKNGPASIPKKCAPREIIRALIRHCGHSLRRVEWSGAGEPPRFQDLVELCNALPNLITLRLVAIYSFPLQASDDIAPMLVLPRLKTLSLGTIPILEVGRPEFALTWDPLLQYASIASMQLPALERFDCEIFPLTSMRFFHVHGHKLRVFRTVPCTVEHALMDALSLCPSLQALALTHRAERVQFPAFHPALRRICIVPATDVVVSTPPRVFHYAVVQPLDHLLWALENMTAPHLAELRILNLGTYATISDYPVWLSTWWRRWNIRGVHFCDKGGRSFQNVCDPADVVLDLVRG